MLATALASAGSAQAVMITEAVGTRNYNMTYDDAFTVVFDETTAGNFPNNASPVSFQGTLTVAGTLTSLQPFEILFEQFAPVVGSVTASGGLRMALEAEVTNGTDKGWSSFYFTLIDLTDLTGVAVGNQSGHRAVAHFHPQFDPDLTGDAVYTTTGLPVAIGVDNTTFIRLAGPALQIGDTLTIEDALIHERNYNKVVDGEDVPVLRTFKLVLSVPEPDTAGLLMIAALGAGVAGRRPRGAPRSR